MLGNEKQHVERIRVVEMGILKWISGKIKKDKIINGNVIAIAPHNIKDI